MLKMTERGLSRASLALLSSFYAPLRIMLPILCERLTSKKALSVWFYCLGQGRLAEIGRKTCLFSNIDLKKVYSIGTTLLSPLLVYYMPHLVLAGREILVLGALSLLDEVAGVMEFVSVMSFHAQVADPGFGSPKSLTFY